MTASPLSDTIAKIDKELQNRRRIEHLETMLNNDDSIYDWSQDDTDALEYALLHIVRLRGLKPVLKRAARAAAI